MNAPLQPETALATRQAFNFELTEARGAETSGTAAAAQAKAMVEARYKMALHRPRNWDQVRQDLILECRRPSFAHNKSAYYRKPIGAGVEGLGIRFVEVALRCMTNVLVETSMMFEDDTKELHRASVTDLESNSTYWLDVKVGKTVERSKPMEDGTYISVRKNSQGRMTYEVPATDDDLLNKRAALISKAIRTLGLRLIPGDLQDEAEAMIKAIRLDKAAKDPAGERKLIIDSFGGIGVKAADLAEYLGQDLDTCSPAQMVELRGLYGAIRDGETTWAAVLDAKSEERADAKPKGKADVKPPKAKTEPQTPPPVAVSVEPGRAQEYYEQKRAEHAAKADDAPTGSTKCATEGEKKFILAKLKARNVPIETAMEECGMRDFDNLTPDGFILLKEYLAALGQ